MQGGTATSRRETLDLPPAFRLVTLRERGDAFEHACRIAAEEGAGTLVWVRRFDLAEFAVVLEPEGSLGEARRSFSLGMAALAGAVASHCPPAMPLAIEWPGTMKFDDAIVGGGRLGWPAGVAEEEPTPWLVFGAVLRLHAMKEIEPGLYGVGASLFDIGFDDADAGQLIEAFARQLLTLTDVWARDGNAAVDARYMRWLSALPPEGPDALRAALIAEPAWRDPETGEPVL
jgi:hypothetical protein